MFKKRITPRLIGSKLKELSNKLQQIFWRKVAPQKWRLRRSIRLTQSRYRPLIDAAEEKGDWEEQRSLVSEYFHELEEDEHELDRLETMYWRQKAERYHVPLPPHGEASKYWDHDEPRRTWNLTDAGINAVRKLIHDEQEWRRNRWIAWAGLLAQILLAAAGVIGALIGLVSVSTHHASK